MEFILGGIVGLIIGWMVPMPETVKNLWAKIKAKVWPSA